MTDAICSCYWHWHTHNFFIGISTPHHIKKSGLSHVVLCYCLLVGHWPQLSHVAISRHCGKRRKLWPFGRLLCNRSTAGTDRSHILQGCETRLRLQMDIWCSGDKSMTNVGLHTSISWDDHSPLTSHRLVVIMLSDIWRLCRTPCVVCIIYM